MGSNVGKYNIMISTNSAYLPYAKNMLRSLFLHHTADEMSVYMPYEDLKEEQVGELARYVADFADKELHPIRIGSDFKNKVQSHNGISIDTYYRILAIDLLPQDMERILYLDVDMVIRGSLEELYTLDITGHPFAACEDILGILNGFHEANKYRMNIPQEYSYFNAGVMLMNLRYLREADAKRILLEKVYADNGRYEYNDQDVLNETYYDKLLYVPWEKYNCPPALYVVDLQKNRFLTYREIVELSKENSMLPETFVNATQFVAEEATIIHYMGDTKPWSTTREKSGVYEIFDRYYEA